MSPKELLPRNDSIVVLVAFLLLAIIYRVLSR